MSCCGSEVVEVKKLELEDWRRSDGGGEGEGEGGGAGSERAKTKTPHKNVGNKKPEFQRIL